MLAIFTGNGDLVLTAETHAELLEDFIDHINSDGESAMYDVFVLDEDYKPTKE